MVLDTQEYEDYRKPFQRGWLADESVRLENTRNFSRELSKTGDLGSHAHVLCWLSEILAKQEVVHLYKAIQASQRPDSEWRAEFLSIFTTVDESDLPPALTDEEAARRTREAYGEQPWTDADPATDSNDVPF